MFILKIYAKQFKTMLFLWCEIVVTKCEIVVTKCEIVVTNPVLTFQNSRLGVNIAPQMYWKFLSDGTQFLKRKFSPFS
jgi:hypothetical protein